MSPKPILICESRLLAKLNVERFESEGQVYTDNLSDLQWRRIRRQLNAGADLVFIGNGHDRRLEALWVYRYASDGVKPHLTGCQNRPLSLALDSLNSSHGRYAYLNSPQHHIHRIGSQTLHSNAYHGVDEEPRADFYPLIEARDRFGGLLGYPAICLKHYDNALGSGHFRGGRWFFFFFDNPQQVMSPSRWQRVLDDALDTCLPRVFLSRLRTEYASYDPGEEARIACHLTNQSDRLVLARVEVAVVCQSSRTPKLVAQVTRAVNRNETIELDWRWPVPHGSHRFAKIQASLYLTDASSDPSSDPTTFIEQEHCGLVIRQPKQPRAAPHVNIDKSQLRINRKTGFFLGTHHYMTQDFFESLWRDLRPEILQRDLKIMRDHGLRIVRLWVDPKLDRTSLRGLDAAIQLCQEAGIVVILTLFTQWNTYLEIEEQGKTEKLLFSGSEDYNLHSLCLRNMKFQRRYVQILARRYKQVPGLIWNLSNEIAAIDPRPDQLAQASDWLDVQKIKQTPPYDAIAVVQAWLMQIRKAIEQAEAHQPMIATYNCSGKNGDSFFTNQVGDMATYHDYSANLQDGIAHQDLSCSGKPLILEEFGIRTANLDEQCDHYEQTMYYALGLPLAAACSYEWGVSSLMRQLPSQRSPFQATTHKTNPTNLRYGGLISQQPRSALGLAPYAASFIYGMIYHGAGIPNHAMRHLSHAAWIGQKLAYHRQPKSVYLVVPVEFSQTPQPKRGRSRKTNLIHKTIEQLRCHHVDYAVVQSDHLHTLPPTAQMLIVPCEHKPSKRLTRALETFQKQGGAVFLGDDFSWTRGPVPGQLKITPGKGIQLLTRSLNRGILAVLHNTTSRKRTLEITMPSGRQVQLTVQKYAMVAEVRKRIVLVESMERCDLDGTPLFESSKHQLIMQSLDGLDLGTSRQRLVLPKGPGTLSILSEMAMTASAVDFPLKPVGLLELNRQGRVQTLEIDQALTQHGILLQAAHPPSGTV